MPEKQFAHKIVPHPEEAEQRPLAVTVRYHYAQAIGWHLAFAESIRDGIGSWGAEVDFALSSYLGHAHLAFLHDALAQGLVGQEASDWAAGRNHSESAELIWERSAKYDVDPDLIRAYRTKRKSEVTA